MATPDPIDARLGLSAEVIALLRAADRVLIGLKDSQTAVIQVTRLPDPLPSLGPSASAEQVRHVVVAAYVHRHRGADLAAEQPLRIGDAQHDLYWRCALDALRPKQVAYLEWSLGWGGVSLRISSEPLVPRTQTPGDFGKRMVRLPSVFLTDPFGTRGSLYALGLTNARRRPRVGETFVLR